MNLGFLNDPASDIVAAGMGGWTVDSEPVLQPDLDQASRQLKALDPGTNHFLFQTFDDRKGVKTPALTRVFYGTLEQHASELTRLNREGAGIFATVNLTTGSSRKKTDICGYRAIFREADEPNLPALPIEPHLIIETSPEKRHEYILISDCQDGEAWDAVMAGMVADWGSDPCAKDRSRVLRLAGFYHQKDPSTPHMVRILHESGHPRYSLENVGHFIKPMVKPERQERQQAPVSAGTHGAGYAQAAMAKELAALACAPEGGRNDQLNRSTFNLGQLVAGGVLDETTVERALVGVAESIGLSAGEIERTFRSGLEDGKRSPRGVPERGERNSTHYTASNLAGDYLADTPTAAHWFKTALDKGSIDRFIDHEPPELDWVLLFCLLAGTVGLLVGPGSVGKSTLALIMALSVASGRELIKGMFKPTRARKALCVFSEDDEAILHHRTKFLVDFYFALDPEGLELVRQNLRIVTAPGVDVRLMAAEGKRLEESDFFLQLEDALKDIEDLGLLILDPVSRLHGGEENDNSAGTYFIQLLERIAQRTRAAIVALHHVSKRAGVSSSGVFDLEGAMGQDAARGASGLTNACRWQCNLFGLPESAAKKELGVKRANPGEYLALRVSKKNYGPPEGQFFLKRGKGGLLSAVQPAEKGVDADLEQVICGLVLNTIQGNADKRLTKKMLVDGFVGDWRREYPAITRPAVERSITALILGDQLHEVQGRNASNRTVAYLTVDPGVNRGSGEAGEPGEPGIDIPPVLK